MFKPQAQIEFDADGDIHVQVTVVSTARPLAGGPRPLRAIGY